MIEKRNLGKTGIEVTSICLGTIRPGANKIQNQTLINS